MITRGNRKSMEYLNKLSGKQKKNASCISKYLLFANRGKARSNVLSGSMIAFKF
jgi:hypothetical protein